METARKTSEQKQLERPHLAILVLAEVIHGIDSRLLEFWEIPDKILDVTRCEYLERRMIRVRQVDQSPKGVPSLQETGD
jgi:hypothetical protein